MCHNELANDQETRERACASEDEFKELAEEQGAELMDDQLGMVSGGGSPRYQHVPQTVQPVA